VAILAIDQGNSRTKLGLFRDGVLLHSWDAPTDKAADSTALAQLLWTAEVPPNTPIGLCSVVPELRDAWVTATDALGYPLTIITGETPTPLRNAYATPATLGPDRLMAAVAAISMVGGPPVIPISLGTATVVDAVGSGPTYLGGMIAPGIGTSARALGLAASALDEPTWEYPAHAIGASTAEALASGLFHFAVGSLNAMLAATRAELGAPAPAIVTGGWADHITPYLDGPAIAYPNLVLLGIARTMAGLG
jgi:type III pantothenate kinase